MNAGIVIITRNRPDRLNSLLLKLRELEHDVPIVIVDNASNKTSFSLYKFSRSPKLRIVRLRKNLFSPSRNTGIRLLKTDIVFFLDDDVYPVCSFVDDVMRLFSEDRKLGLVTFELYDLHEQRVLTGNLIKNPRYFPEAAFAVRRSVWEKVGGFPQFSPARAFAAEFSIRLISSGYHLLYFPAIKIYHICSHKNPLGKSRFHKIWYLPAWVGFFIRHFGLLNTVVFCTRVTASAIYKAMLEGWQGHLMFSLLLLLKMVPLSLIHRKRVSKEIEKLYKEPHKKALFSVPILRKVIPEIKKLFLG